MSEEFEELEQIPWAALAGTPGDTKARIVTVVTAVIAVAIVAAIWLASRGASPTVSLPVEPTTQSSAPTLAPALAGTVPFVDDVAPVEAEPVLSEADLMAIDLGDEERLAVAHAEWLVRDYLTIDDDPVVAERIARLLPDAVRRTEPSYVEWVRAFAVDSPEPGRYQVEVLVSVLAGGDEGFTRAPAAALVVDLAVDVDGAVQLLSEPTESAAPSIDGPG